MSIVLPFTSSLAGLTSEMRDEVMMTAVPTVASEMMKPVFGSSELYQNGPVSKTAIRTTVRTLPE